MYEHKQGGMLYILKHHIKEKMAYANKKLISHLISQRGKSAYLGRQKSCCEA